MSDFMQRLLAMTGESTTDPNEAVDQWEQEREALAEFWGVMETQAKLLTSLAHRIDDLTPALRSRKGVNWEKVNQIIEDLNKWRAGVVKSEKETMEVREQWTNIKMF